MTRPAIPAYARRWDRPLKNEINALRPYVITRTIVSATTLRRNEGNVKLHFGLSLRYGLRSSRMFGE
jgi:hypothetical protein